MKLVLRQGRWSYTQSWSWSDSRASTVLALLKALRFYPQYCMEAGQEWSLNQSQQCECSKKTVIGVLVCPTRCVLYSILQELEDLFMYFSFGPSPLVLRAYSWQTWGSIGSVRDWTQVCCLQGKHFILCYLSDLLLPFHKICLLPKVKSSPHSVWYDQ